jgi:hypothetical protein
MYSPNSSVECRLRECEKTTRESGLTQGCIVLNESPELRISANAIIPPSDTSDFTLEIMLNPSNTRSPYSSPRAEKLAKLVKDLESMGYEFDHRDTGPIVGRLRVHLFTIDAEYKSLAFVIGMFFRSISNEDATMQGRLSCSS